MSQYPLLDQHFNLELQPSRTADELSLEAVSELHARLGFPERTFNSIHVTGTKGKGSTAAMMSAVLQEAGFRVGVYASPHIISLEERIRINGTFIPKARLRSILEEKMRPIVEEMEAAGKNLTFFEILTVAAFEFFAEEKVDFALIEVGMGGRTDATNICSPCICVLTNISLDHTAQLGSTVEAIAAEKAGIIKSGVPVIIGSMPAETKERVYPIIHAQALQKSAPDAWAGQHFPALTGPEFWLGMPGNHQRANAAIVCKATELFAQWVSVENLRKGLERAKLPGRLEVVAQKPSVILDAAHTPDSMAQAVDWIQQTFPKIPKIIIFAAASDKNWQTMLETLLQLQPQKVLLTEFPQNRSTDSRKMEDFLRPAPTAVQRIPNAIEAIREAQRQISPDGLILVTGSFFLLREIRGLFR